MLSCNLTCPLSKNLNCDLLKMDLQGTSSVGSKDTLSIDTQCQPHSQQDSESSPALCSNLPEPPEEPLQSDCCGTGCSPCVFDIYHDDLAKWKELEQLTPEERTFRREGRRTREGPCRKEVSVALSVDEYREFEVVQVKEECEGVFVYKFGLPLHNVLGVGRGQHMTLRVKTEVGYLTRQYTPIGDLEQQGSFTIIIKIYKEGQMSAHVKEWKVGSVASWRGPFGEFQYSPNKYRHILMLACGTGIAPMVQLAQGMVENEEEETFVRCLYGCRTQHQILLKKDLEYFATFWNFTILYALSHSSQESVAHDPGMVKYGEEVQYGRITKKMVDKEVKGMEEEGKGRDVVLICGTKSFDKDMIKYLTMETQLKFTFFKF